MSPRLLVIIALILLSAFLHAAWNALLRVEQDKDRSLAAAIVAATGFAVLVAGLRWSLGMVPFTSLAGVSYTLIASACEAMSFATLARAMERGTLGMVYTVSRGGAVLAVWPLSIALLDEVVTAPAIIGSLLLLGGLALSGLGTGRTGRTDQRGAIGWAALCALSIAAYHLAYKAALSEATNPSACFAHCLS
ncbi:MAG: permease, partial [Gemmatimonadaceae bacterium]